MNEKLLKEEKIIPQTESPTSETWDNKKKIEDDTDSFESSSQDYLEIDYKLYSKNQSYSKKLGRFIAEQNNS